MKEIKAVIDTNVLISILKGSASLSPIYTAFKEEKFKLIICSGILKELSSVLLRPKLKIDKFEIKELFRVIRLKAIRIELPPPYINLCRDSKDNFLLELTLESNADFIVTGDDDLLTIKGFSTPIITPKEFLKILQG